MQEIALDPVCAFCGNTKILTHISEHSDFIVECDNCHKIKFLRYRVSPNFLCTVCNSPLIIVGGDYERVYGFCSMPACKSYTIRKIGKVQRIYYLKELVAMLYKNNLYCIEAINKLEKAKPIPKDFFLYQHILTVVRSLKCKR